MAEVKALISPSILAADFARLGEDVADVCARGIDYLHIDVMDGNFVPNISFGPAVMKSLNSVATVPYDVHLMVDEPVRYIKEFKTDNTEYITVHYEACSDVRETIRQIHELGIKAGVSIKPGTEPEVLDELLPDALSYALEPADSGADLILFGFSIVEADGREREYHEFDCLVRSQDMHTAFPRLYKANLLNQVWGKLYSARILKENGLRFQDYLWGEDRLFVFDYLEHCRLIAVRSECKYRYIMHAGESLISRFYPKKFTVCIEADIRAQELCRKYGVADDADLRYMFAKSVFSCITTLFSPSCTLSDEGRIIYIKEIRSNPRVQQRCRDTSGGAPVNTLCYILRHGKPRTILSTFRMVALTGDLAPDLFMKLKHRK